MTYVVPRDIYEEAFDRELPECVGAKITVDRRGYAEEVAEELGEDYLNNTILVFDEEQAEEPLLRSEYSFVPELVNTVYEESEMVEYASPENPLRTELYLSSSGGTYTPTVTVDDSKTTTRLEDAIQLREEVRTLTENDLKDREQVERLVEKARSAIGAFGDLDEVMLEREIASITVPQFSFDYEGSTGFSFPIRNGESGLTIITSEEGEDPWAADRTYNVHEQTGPVLEALYDRGELHIREVDVDDRIREVGYDYFEEQGIDDLSKPQFYRELRSNWDDLPAECHALRDLKSEEFAVESEEDMVKLDFLKPESGEAAEILHTVRNVLAERFPDTEEHDEEPSQTRPRHEREESSFDLTSLEKKIEDYLGGLPDSSHDMKKYEIDYTTDSSDTYNNDKWRY